MSYDSLVSLDNLSEEEWLQYRRMGIGGSDAGVVLGLSPFESRFSLYADKIGELPIENESNAAMEWGSRLEKVVAQHFSEKNEFKIENVNRILRSEQHPFMLANPDRRIVGTQTPGILEIKTTRARYAPLWDEKIPPYVYAQLQHYLAVTGYEWGYVAVLIGKDEYRDYRFERSDDFIEDMIQEESDFWLNHVEPEVPPEPDGHDTTSKALDEIYSDTNDSVIEIDDDDVASLVSTYDRLKEAKDELDEDIDSIKNTIKSELENHEKAIVHVDEDESRTVTWYQQSRRYPDKDLIEEDYPDLIQGGEWSEDYSNESSYRVFRIH